jgi:aspartyl-tRNA(Asn)/glutamyl-tRNA(Gln) amidotransferase subunit A
MTVAARTVSSAADAASDVTLLPVNALSQEITAGRLSPLDLVEACLARIAATEPKLKAFVEVYATEARADAEAADRALRRGQTLGPLHGIPIAVKDLVDIAGRITTGGSKTRRARRAEATATIVKKLTAAGMIVLGKTHTVEFAFGGWGTNQSLGTPWNPWDLGVPRTPGGSSSGSGVAVGARMVPCAIGTDTGGSVRMPASWCGITGLKATIGQISAAGILPLSASLDTPGPMARDVVDAALLFEVLQGFDPLDPATRRGRPTPVMATIERGVRGLRLARLPAAERGIVDAGVLDAYDRSLEVLAGLGAEIVDVVLPVPLGDYVNMSTIMEAEAYFAAGDIAEDAAEPMDEDVRKRILAGAKVSARDYLAQAQRRQELMRAMDAALCDVDALLTPTTPMVAVALAEVDQAMLPSRLTRFVNYLEMCAVAVPNGFSRGLPTSLQIACRGYEEAMALRIGRAFQKATDWHTRLPPAVTPA